MINIGSDTRLTTLIKCIISNLSQNYHLKCKDNESFVNKLQRPISLNDESNILLINFNDYNGILIAIEETQKNRIYF